MKRKKRQQYDGRRGSAMILVVVVTVLLAVVGVIFVMVARLSEMETSSVIDSRDLDAAVDSVVMHIQSVMVKDLFGAHDTEAAPTFVRPIKNPATNLQTCPWLACLEPRKDLIDDMPANTDGDPTNDWFIWESITDLSAGVISPKWDLILRDGKKKGDWSLPAFGGIVGRYQDFSALAEVMPSELNATHIQGLPADADGDGVADSMWLQVPAVTTSRGKPVFAAVRILDNCAMLNLNTAYCFYQAEDDPPGAESRFECFWRLKETTDPYKGTIFTSPFPYGDGGRYLTEVNYLPFLRGRDLFSEGDFFYNLSHAKKFSWGALQTPSLLTPAQAHTVVMEIENSPLHPSLVPSVPMVFFDIGDELEMRYRYVMTSPIESRFERADVGNFTFDAGGNVYAALAVPREDKMEDNIPHFARWKWRIDPVNFDHLSGAYQGTWAGQDMDLSYRYDRRHISTFYSYDRPLRSGTYPKLDAALEADFEALVDAGVSIERAREQIQRIEAVFRPVGLRPIDMRRLTDPTNPDRITANTVGARRNILHLLYAYRAYFLSADYSDLEPGEQTDTLHDAALKAAQAVANLIDYLDDDTLTTQGPFYGTDFGEQDNLNPTYIDKEIVDAILKEAAEGVAGIIGNEEYDFGLKDSDVVYGYERQPFFSEIYCHYDGSVSGGAVRALAIELLNPYDTPIALDGWRFRFGLTAIALDGNEFVVPARKGDEPGRLTIWQSQSLTLYPVQVTSGTETSKDVMYPNLSFLGLTKDQNLTLQRPDPRDSNEYLIVDEFRGTGLSMLFSDTYHTAKRDDTQWRFTNAEAYRVARLSAPADSTLGRDNTMFLNWYNGYQLPVANDQRPMERLADFLQTMWVSSHKNSGEPKPVTRHIADAEEESDIRLDVAVSPELLDYLCFLNRSEAGSLPGRININTAAKHVIAAAIAPQLVMAKKEDEQNALYLAEQIIAHRPYRRVSEVVEKIDAFGKFAEEDAPDVGDPLIEGDIEERDWVLSRLSNIFTVRSDVFTAYILVRLGPDGPQRRMIAILDRSQVWSPDDCPTVVALQPVPEPR